jgi:hypothetical protein
LLEEEKRMKSITVEARTTDRKPYIPLPWQTFYEFARIIWEGCVVTFGPRRKRTNPYRIGPHSRIAASSISHIGLGLAIS